MHVNSVDKKCGAMSGSLECHSKTRK